MDSPEPTKRKLVKQFLLETMQTILLSLFFYGIISSLIGRYEVKQVSMEPSFHQGQLIVVSRLDKILSPFVHEVHAAGQNGPITSGPKRGQVIVFYNTPNRSEPPLVKRVIGVPGDTVSILNGTVSLNGVQLDEPYFHGQETNCDGQFCGPLTLADGTYFVMGDNRNASMDSRSFGPISQDLIVGRVVMRYWPLNTLEFYP